MKIQSPATQKGYCIFINFCISSQTSRSDVFYSKRYVIHSRAADVRNHIHLYGLKFHKFIRMLFFNILRIQEVQSWNQIIPPTMICQVIWEQFGTRQFGTIRSENINQWWHSLCNSLAMKLGLLSWRTGMWPRDSTWRKHIAKRLQGLAWQVPDWFLVILIISVESIIKQHSF